MKKSVAAKVLMALKKALEGMMGYKTVAQLRIQEHNEEALLTDIASFQR